MATTFDPAARWAEQRVALWTLDEARAQYEREVDDWNADPVEGVPNATFEQWIASEQVGQTEDGLRWRDQSVPQLVWFASVRAVAEDLLEAQGPNGAMAEALNDIW